jgi:hypothetical protein
VFGGDAALPNGNILLRLRNMLPVHIAVKL